MRWIVGSSSGIGLVQAKRYLQAGVSVGIFAHDYIDEAMITLNKHRPKLKKTKICVSDVQGYHADMLDTEQSTWVFDKAKISLDAPNTVINSAGIAIAKSFEETSEAGFQRQIHINLIGSRNVAYTALPYLKLTRHYSKQRPELVFIASKAGLFPCYGYSEYATSTFGAVGLADVLRM